MTTETESLRQARDQAGPPLLATVASEWMKLRSMRSTWVTATTGIVLGVAVSAVLAMAVGATWDDWSPADRAEFDPVLAPLIGGVFSGIMIIMLGVKAGASEYSAGLVRLTLAATPRRGRVLLAKSVVVTGISWVVGAVATAGMFVTAQLVFRGYGVTTSLDLDGEAFRAIVTGVALVPVFPLIGLALAVVFRSGAGAISAVLAILFAPAVLGSLLPAWWQENVLAYLPGPATDSISVSHVDDSSIYLPTWVATLVVAAWLVAFFGTAYRVLARRDA